MRGFHKYDTVPHDWDAIVRSRESLASEDDAFRPLSDLCSWLAGSPFREAGLCAVTSMHDLIVGPSRDVLANPYLVISFDFDLGKFGLLYEDGSSKPWSRTVEVTEIREVLERFFVKRARWYRAFQHSS
jgi:hypothetical protein